MSKWFFNRVVGRRIPAILILVIFIGLSAVPIQGAVVSQRTFKDVSRSDWFYEEVTTLVAKGIVSGYEDSTFRPDNTVTVAEFLKMSMEAVDKKLLLVNGGKWYATYVETAIQDGIIKENDFDSYERPITRSEMGSIVDKLLGLTTAKREDYYKYIRDISEVKSVYRNSMIDVFVAGIITGYDDYTIRGGNNAKRSEASVVIIRMIDMSKRSPFDITIAEEPIVEETIDETEVELVTSSAIDLSANGRVSIGMSFEDAKTLLGTNYKVHSSQFGYTWYCYVSDYNQMEFIGVSYSKVVAYYSNYGLDQIETSGSDSVTYYKDENNMNTSVLIVNNSYLTEKPITSEITNGMEQMLFYLINGTRAQHGIEPLLYSSSAAAVASDFSNYLNSIDGLAHIDANGNNSKTRMLNAGIPVSNGYCENVACGYKTAFDMHNGFVHSAGHLPNILDERVKYVGIGIIYDASDKYKYYVTEDYYNTK